MIDINLDAEITLHNVTWAGFDGDEFFIDFQDTNARAAYYTRNVEGYHDVFRHTNNNSSSKNYFEICGVELVNKEELENFNPGESSDLKIILKSKDMEN